MHNHKNLFDLLANMLIHKKLLNLLKKSGNTFAFDKTFSQSGNTFLLLIKPLVSEL